MAQEPTTAARVHKSERSRALTIMTLEKLDELALPSTPHFYELWYRYFDGDPEIVRALDAIEGPKDEAACQKVYNRYLSAQSQDSAVSKANDKVQSSIAQLATMLRSATSATAEYGQQLDGASEKMGDATSAEDFTAVIAGILSETQKMVEKNRELESELNTSSQQVMELKQYLDTVKKEATTDSLTGISNRKAFDLAIAQGIDISTEENTPFVLMLLDIDHFKKFNDVYGHQTGDQVLRLVARTLVSNIKGQDMAARYGGEEFAILLPSTPIEAGMKVADALRRHVEQKELVNKSTNEKLGTITISIGIAQYKAGESITEFIDRADAALYQAKGAGRNRVMAAA
ncbi:MAG TPA: GGDEF domain-containing protein [Patescibacteria group bacterium]|nr:GGDEF domain-containing protein [Patescibacteria group bacterium]